MNQTGNKILVIDDEVGMREGIRRILELEGYIVDTAEAGRPGIEKGTALEYDLYFIDLKMPDMSGDQVLYAIKTRYPEAICVMITAYASIDTAVETTRLGAFQYIPKPFTPEDLLSIVRRALEHRTFVIEARRLREEREIRLLELTNEKSRLRTIINALDDGILVVNQEGQVVLFNPAFLKLLDIQQEIQIGQLVFNILPVELTNQIVELLAQTDKLQAIKQEIVIHPPAKLVIMANTTPIVGEGDMLLGVVSVIRDISELKKIDLLKSQFVNMAAHELKAPLTAVQGYLEMVVERTLGDVQDVYNGYLERSLDRTKSLVSLINDLLNITRMESGRVRREVKRVDIKKILEKSVQTLNTEIVKSKLTFVFNVPDSLIVDADADEVLRIFNNLIENAIKYNREGGRVEIVGGKNGHYAQISVQDSGIGMTAEEKERLFEDFFRAKNPHTRRITGTGLGLTIVKKLVDAYAGKIRVDSEYEKGSTFTVSLPLSRLNEKIE
jgi:two-component system, OmpR family, phosphate regulon sensor histidine kinase PhoR